MTRPALLGIACGLLVAGAAASRALADTGATCNAQQGDAVAKKVCPILAKGSACRANFADTRYKTVVASHQNRYRELRALPSAGAATAEQIREVGARKDFGRFELQASDCAALFPRSAQEKQEKTFGEKAADTKVGNAIERAGNAEERAVKNFAKQLEKRVELLRDWVKKNAKAKIKAALVNKALPAAFEKGGARIEAEVKKVLEPAVTRAVAALVTPSMKVQLGAKICFNPTVLSMQASVCNIYVPACAASCEGVAYGIFNRVQGKIAGMISDQIYSRVVTPLLKDGTDRLYPRIASAIDRW